MARRRMIDPNIWMSEDVSKLNIFERLLLIGMFSNADDEGRGRANLPLLRSMIFPYDDISTSEIGEALDNICQYIGLILYEVDGNKYYRFERWKKWQRVDKPVKSMIPEQYENDSKNESENDSKNESENDSKNESENDSENNSGRKEKKRKEDNIKEKEDKRRGAEESGSISGGSCGSDFNIYLYMQKCGFVSISPVMKEKIDADIEIYSLEEVKKAVEIADNAGKHSYSYVHGILEKRRAGVNEKVKADKELEEWANE